MFFSCDDSDLLLIHQKVLCLIQPPPGPAPSCTEDLWSCEDREVQQGFPASEVTCPLKSLVLGGLADFGYLVFCSIGAENRQV